LSTSHYPQGRHATVNYPDVDLKFVNDTRHWILLRTYVGSYSLDVELYGAPLNRRVASETRPREETASGRPRSRASGAPGAAAEGGRRGAAGARPRPVDVHRLDGGRGE